ncbi:MAG TPA: hypothetical protein VK866_19895 [Acidimicrobiales bacterium]|nr:hypothetical protein [Acidimicrobiales bacterium]
METTQLALITEEPTEWRLDDHTRELGRKGIAEARRAVQAALAAEHAERSGRPTTGHPTAA